MDNMPIKQEIEEITIGDVVVESTDKLQEEASFNSHRNEIKTIQDVDVPKDFMDLLDSFESGNSESKNHIKNHKLKVIASENSTTNILSNQKFTAKTVKQYFAPKVQSTDNNSKDNSLQDGNSATQPVNNTQESGGPHNHICNLDPDKCSINCSKKNCYNHFFSTGYNTSSRTCSKMISKLGCMFSENNQVSSDEDEDAIHAEVNKMRMRNGLAPIDCRKKSNSTNNSLLKKQQFTLSERWDLASSQLGDSNRSSSSDGLVIDESSVDETDSDSVTSISSIKIRKNIIFKPNFTKRSRSNSEEDLCPYTHSDNKKKDLDILQLNSTDFYVVQNQEGQTIIKEGDLDRKKQQEKKYRTQILRRKRYLREKNKRSRAEPSIIISNSRGQTVTLDSSQRNTDSIESETLDSSGVNISDNTTNKDNNLAVADTNNSATGNTLEQMVNTIQNIKKESDDTIPKEQEITPTSKDTNPQPSNNNQEQPPNNVFQCIPCKLRFDAHLDLKKHILSVHIQVYQCPWCPFRTLIPSQFQKHVSVHLKRGWSSESSGSQSPLRIKQLSSSSSSRSNSSLEIVEME